MDTITLVTDGACSGNPGPGGWCVIVKKENEIKELNLKHINLKNEIQLNQQSYEKLIDDATNEISNFIEKANLENLS